MPIDPRIPLGVQPVQIDSPMQTLAQISQLQNMRQQREEAQQRIAIQQQQLEMQQATAALKAEETQKAREVAGRMAPVLTGKPTAATVEETIRSFEDPEMQAAALGTWQAFQDKQSEIDQRISTAGKNDADVKRLKVEQLGNLARDVRDVGQYHPAAIEFAFKVAGTGDTTGMVDLYHHRWLQDPSKGKELIDGLITQAEPNITLGTNERRITPTGTQIAQGVTPIPEPKVDFSMYLPLYARDVLNKPVDQMTAQDYAAAKKQYEDLNNPPFRGYAPIVIQTERGPELLNRGTATTQPIMHGGAGGAAGGAAPTPVKPPPTAQERNLAAQFKRGKVVVDELAEMARDLKFQSGAMARITAPAERAKALLNLNNSLKLYEDSLRGYAPLLARNLGHTGVLTDIDLLRTESLLPQLGNSEELKIMKINRMTSMFDKIEKTLAGYDPDAAPAGGGGTAGAAAPAAAAPVVAPAANQDADWQLFQSTVGSRRK